MGIEELNELNKIFEILDNTIFIFLDDIRDPPGSKWIRTKTAEETYTLILALAKESKRVMVSLDHDLGEGLKTGYDLLNWIEKDIAINPDFRPNLEFVIHSDNPVGRKNMEAAIESIKRLYE